MLEPPPTPSPTQSLRSLTQWSSWGGVPHLGTFSKIDLNFHFSTSQTGFLHYIHGKYSNVFSNILRTVIVDIKTFEINFYQRSHGCNYTTTLSPNIGDDNTGNPHINVFVFCLFVCLFVCLFFFWGGGIISLPSFHRDRHPSPRIKDILTYLCRR